MIKTLEAREPRDFDEMVNAFEADYIVFATQTHVTRIEGTAPIYTAVVFYHRKRTEEEKKKWLEAKA